MQHKFAAVLENILHIKVFSLRLSCGSKARNCTREKLRESEIQHREGNISHTTNKTLIKMFLQFMLEIKAVKNFSGRNRVL